VKTLPGCHLQPGSVLSCARWLFTLLVEDGAVVSAASPEPVFGGCSRVTLGADACRARRGTPKQVCGSMAPAPSSRHSSGPSRRTSRPTSDREVGRHPAARVAPSSAAIRPPVSCRPLSSPSPDTPLPRVSSSPRRSARPPPLTASRMPLPAPGPPGHIDVTRRTTTEAMATTTSAKAATRRAGRCSRPATGLMNGSVK
jgi:hypothetical protein